MKLPFDLHQSRPEWYQVRGRERDREIEGIGKAQTKATLSYYYYSSNRKMCVHLKRHSTGKF